MPEPKDIAWSLHARRCIYRGADQRSVAMLTWDQLAAAWPKIKWFCGHSKAKNEIRDFLKLNGRLTDTTEETQPVPVVAAGNGKQSDAAVDYRESGSLQPAPDVLEGYRNIIDQQRELINQLNEENDRLTKTLKKLRTKGTGPCARTTPSRLHSSPARTSKSLET